MVRSRSTKLLTMLGIAAVALAIGVSDAVAGLSISVPTIEAHVTRTWSWTIAKSASQPVLTLAKNEAYNESYSVTAGTSGHVDSNPSVTGVMHVVYPAPGINLFGVDGLLYTGPPASYTLTPLTLAGPDCAPPFPEWIVTTVDCNFNVPAPALDPGFVGINAYGCPADADCTLNPDAVIVAKGSSAPFDFATATAAGRDDCVTVTDTLAGNLGSPCTAAAPATFSYTGSIGPFTSCGDYQVGSTSSFVTNTTGATGSSGANVAVHVPCTGGCTLSIRYLLNHLGSGPLADLLRRLLPLRLGATGGVDTVNVTTLDRIRALLGLPDADDATSNGINGLTLRLLAAKLNAANGADLSAISDAVSAAESFLASHQPGDWSNLTKAQKAAVLLVVVKIGRYLGGYIGPGHCSE